MKKRIGCLLLCLGIIAAICGCTQEPEVTEPETTEITFPTLDQEKTPLEMLDAAVEQTRALDAFAIDYVRIVGEDRFALSAQLQVEADGSCTALTITRRFTEDGTTEEETSRYYHGTLCCEKGMAPLEQDTPYTPSQILSQVPQFSGLTKALSSQPLNVIPSYDGSFRFQTEDLSWEDFSPLLCGCVTEAPEETEGYRAALTIAPEGHLSALEFTGGDIRITLTITVLKEDQPITAPEWISDQAAAAAS